MPKAENYQTEETTINGVPVTVATYKIGDRFYCRVANKEPGATISRAEGTSQQQARERALATASERLQ